MLTPTPLCLCLLVVGCVLAEPQFAVPNTYGPPSSLSGFQHTFRVIPNGLPGTVQFPFFGSREAAGLTSVSSFTTGHSELQNDAVSSFQNGRNPTFQYAQSPRFAARAPAFQNTGSSSQTQAFQNQGFAARAPAVHQNPGFSAQAQSFQNQGFAARAPAVQNAGFSAQAQAAQNQGFAARAPAVQNAGFSEQAQAAQNQGFAAQAPVFQNSDGLELLPPKQHVVGTRYPGVDPGPGYRFPSSQLQNTTPPSNLL